MRESFQASICPWSEELGEMSRNPMGCRVRGGVSSELGADPVTRAERSNECPERVMTGDTTRSNVEGKIIFGKGFHMVLLFLTRLCVFMSLVFFV